MPSQSGPVKLSVTVLRSQEWKLIYAFDGKTKFKIYGSDIPDFVIIHDTSKVNGKDKVRIHYRVFKRETDSPTQACRWWNSETAKRRSGGRNAPGGVEQAKAVKESRGGRGNQRTGLEA